MNYTQQAWAKLTFEERFPIVRASALSRKDSFMQFTPNTETQNLLFEDLIYQIERGAQDFRRPAIDPSINAEGKIFYEAGREPATGIMPEIWEQLAKDFMPEKNSRLAFNSAYNLFLGTILKYLVEERNLPVAMAWSDICFKSETIANVMNSVIPESKGKETTGSRLVGKWADLGNVQKIVADGETARYMFRGCTYKNRSPYCNLASKSTAIPHLHITNEDLAKYATGWVIMAV